MGFISKCINCSDTYCDSIVIDSSGNVGIGTDSPDAKLHLSKTSFSTTFTSADSYIRIGKGENAQNGYQFIGFGYNDQPTSQVPAYIGFQQTGTPGNYTKGDLVFGTRYVTTDAAPTERMRIESDGNLRVYDVIDNIANTLTLNGRNTGEIHFQSGGSERMKITSGGGCSFIN